MRTAGTLALHLCLGCAVAGALPLVSFDTGHTITKVRTADLNGRTAIVGATYDGAILALDQGGEVLWNTPTSLSGCMVHDLWCADITGDRNDEILAAGADGTLYCLDSDGGRLWTFAPSSAPMSQVCVVRRDGVPHVVCGGYDCKLYYLTGSGSLLKTVDSRAYSKEKPWGKDRTHLPEDYRHVANTIRPFRRRDGTEALAVHGTIWSTSAAGHLYLFEPLADTPYQAPRKLDGGIGDLRAADLDGDGADEFLCGSTSMIRKAHVSTVDQAGEQTKLGLADLRKHGIDWFGYRVAQPALVRDAGNPRLLVLFGSRILLLPTSLVPGNTDDVVVLAGRHAFNDMWKPAGMNKLILASAQSGGSCVHVLDLDDPDWKQAYAALEPPGKIAAILANTATVRQQLESAAAAPAWEKPVPPVTFMTESRRNEAAADAIARIEAHHDTPIFLNTHHLIAAEVVDRTGFDPVYREKRDRRMRYVWTSDQFVDFFAPLFEGTQGIAYWGGHGNDPYLTSLRTQKRLFDIAASQGKRLVTIYPELERHDAHFAWVMENHLYPMADYARGRNVNIFVRTKHAFWHGIVYLPMWAGLVSGEYADIFVPAMEETTDKTMEQSIAARLGLWAGGSVNQWGARCARDNTSFDRTRQFSHQALPNHFLRQMVYNISSGATYLNNFPVDQDYMSVLWELVAKGIVYAARREELVSLSPVHLSMVEPDARFLHTGNSVKWMSFFDEEEEAANPMVFGRLNGTWPGAPVTAWDFSRYAAGVRDRRLNYLPPFEHGLVMITPPQTGVHADPDAPRGRLVDHLHPLYRGILTEFFTDGRNYVSADGTRTFPADEYWKTVRARIKEGAGKLPLTVTGKVAWVCAQSAPTHLRLTLVDGGYINPGERTASVTFGTVRPRRISDVLSGETLPMDEPTHVEIGVPCGLFRFIDVELNDRL